MREKLTWALLIILLLVSGFFIGREIVKKSSQESDDTSKISTEPPLEKGSVAITDVNFGQVTPPFNAATLSGLRVEDVEFFQDTIGGKEHEILELTVSYVREGEDRRLIIPIFNKVYVKRVIATGDDYASSPDELMGVKEILPLLKKDNYISVIFIYIPQDREVSTKDLREYWEPVGYNLGLTYLDLGFGSNPINLSDYLENLFVESNQARTDYTKAMVGNIIIK